ncbi:MAG: 50S ribosomal protein L23 [Phycisphaerales bacterium JB065]
MEAHHIIKKPLLTEKTTFASGEHNRHAFIVSRTATKTDIKKAVEDLYSVRVLGVNTVTTKESNRRYRYGMISGKSIKKAIVKVHPEDTIEIL